VLALYNPEAHNALATVTSFDVRTGALSYLSMILCIQGQFEQAALLERAGWSPAPVPSEKGSNTK
jgi:hypothetical protein